MSQEGDPIETWHQLQSGRTPADFASERPGWRDIVPSGVTISNTSKYTEITHTVYADIEGAESIDAGSVLSGPTDRRRRQFIPTRIVAKWHWRSQLGDVGWGHPTFELSGRWLPRDGEKLVGSGCVLMSVATAPAWAKAFAEANRPISKLVDE